MARTTKTDIPVEKRTYKRTARTLTADSLIAVDEPTPDELVAAKRNARNEVQTMFDELVSGTALNTPRAI